MGLFDTILAPHNCYNCGYCLKDYQTKDLDCFLNLYRLGDSIKLDGRGKTPESFEVHDFCHKCKTSISGTAYTIDGALSKIVEYHDDNEVVIADLNSKDN